jgi:hypothetical protein
MLVNTKKYSLKTLTGEQVFTNGVGKITLDASKKWREFTCTDATSSERCKESNKERAKAQTGRDCEWVPIGETEVFCVPLTI